MAEQIEVELPHGKRTFSVSQLIDKDHDRYTVRAWHWSRPVNDSTAYAAMKAGTLPEPTQLADNAPTDPNLEDAVHAAFASHAGYVAALSTRADAFSFGSAGETMQGAKVAQSFKRMTAAFSLHDGLRVEQIGTDLAWAVANVDFKNKAGTETFRVLAVFVREGGAWKVALGHWSNGFPIPGAP
jgi:hypothetical protein